MRHSPARELFVTKPSLWAQRMEPPVGRPAPQLFDGAFAAICSRQGQGRKRSGGRGVNLSSQFSLCLLCSEHP